MGATFTLHWMATQALVLEGNLTVETSSFLHSCISPPFLTGSVCALLYCLLVQECLATLLSCLGALCTLQSPFCHMPEICVSSLSPSPIPCSYLLTPSQGDSVLQSVSAYLPSWQGWQGFFIVPIPSLSITYSHHTVKTFSVTSRPGSPTVHPCQQLCVRLVD